MMKVLMKNAYRMLFFLLAVTVISCNDDDDNEPADTAAPVITLLGQATVNLTIGDAYTDAGATATDNVDGDITADIVVGGDVVDANTVGVYAITYNVSDAAGNAATQVTRTVNVSVAPDTEVPVITLLGDASVNLTVGGTFTDAGATATDNVDGDITAGIVVGGDEVDTNTAGTYVITYNVSDVAGNDAVEVTREVIVSAPTCTDTDLVIPMDFDCDGIDYTPTTFNGAAFEVIDNPELSGVNDTETKVGQIINVGAEFEGLFFSLANPVSLANENVITMKVYSTVVTPILLKLEGNGAVELLADHGGTGWELIEWEFSSTESFPTLTIFIDGFGTTAGTFYIDDIQQKAGSGGGPECTTVVFNTNIAVNGDLETNDKTGWTEFPNGAATFEVSDAQNNGGTYSAKMVAPEAADIVIKQANLACDGSIPAGATVTITFDLYGSLTGDGGVVFAEFFSELTGEGTSKAEILGGGAPLTPTQTWTSYSYTTTTGSDVSGGITLQLKAACGAVAGCNVEAYFDNVTISVAD
jgi:hypothetical protein